MKLKPLIFVRFAFSSFSGGYKRLYEILKRGKQEGIDYIIVTDLNSCKKAVKIFPDFIEVLSQYKVFIKNFKENAGIFPILKQLFSYRKIFKLALFISEVARNEKVDLIVSPGEGILDILVCYLASTFCSKPWTVIFQGTKELLQPTPGPNPINNIVNAIKHVVRKESFSKISFLSKIGLSIELMELLKVAEKSLMLTVGRSLSEEINFLSPKVHFHIIDPGNGINTEIFYRRSSSPFIYDAIFFSRFVPEKGIFDLLEIWKFVVKKIPGAKLAIVGTVNNNIEFVKQFKKILSHYGLHKNIIFIEPQDSVAISNLVSSSKVTIYPSSFDVFPLTVLESLACGTPVIAYDILAIKYNFGKCEAVLRCPVKDYLSMAKNVVSLLENEDLRIRLAKKAEEYAVNFDWKRVVKAEKEAYFKVIAWFNFHKKRCQNLFKDV